MNKKGQEELVGFVLVVVLVSIVLVILLAIFLARSDGNENYKDSREVSDFLTGAMEFTTECSVSFEPDYLTIGELQKECYAKRNCLSGIDACEVLNSTIKNLINNSWNIGQDRPIKGYKYESSYILNRTNNQEPDRFLALYGGNCSYTLRGAEDVSPDYPGRIVTRLDLCY